MYMEYLYSIFFVDLKQFNEIIKVGQSLSELVLDLDPDLECQSKVKSGFEYFMLMLPTSFSFKICDK